MIAMHIRNSAGLGVALCLAAGISHSLAASGNDAKFTSLGQPCRGFNVLSADFFRDPATERDCLVMGNTNEASGLELLFLDPQTNAMKTIVAPAGQGSWSMMRVGGDRLVQGTYYDGTFLVFDLKAGRYIKSVKVPGEQYIWNTALGKDGKVYGGTYPGAVLASLDLETYKVKKYDCPLPGVHQYLRYVNATTDGRIVCTYDMASSTSLVFDPATEKFTSAPAQMEPLGRTALWEGLLVQAQQAYDGRTLLPVSKAFPTPATRSWSVDTNLTTSKTLYLRDKNTVYSYKKSDPELVRLVEWDSRIGGATRAVLPGDKILCSIGQDTFTVSRETTAVKLRPLPVSETVYKADGTTTQPAMGRPNHFLAADGDGKLWGGPHFGQTLWQMDLASRLTTNTSIVSVRGGEVYDVAFTGGKVYAVAYVGGEVIEYDPQKPFDLFYGHNPRTIATVPGYIRPSAGVELGKDGLLYAGWLAKYGIYGGAVSITDPRKESGKNTTVLENPLGEQGIRAIATDDNWIYVGTTLEGNGLPANPKGTAQLGIIDKSSKKVVWSEPAGPRVPELSSFVLDGKTGILAMRAEGRLRLFDTRTRTWKDQVKAPAVLDNIAGDNEGRILFGSDRDLLLYDLANTTVTQRLTPPVKAEKITRDPSTGTVFVASGSEVVQVEF